MMAGELGGDRIILRIKSFAVILTAAGGVLELGIEGWRAALSLTIGGAIAIFNFLVLEWVTAVMIRPDAERAATRAVALPLLVTLATVGALFAAFRWKGFSVRAGLLGLSVVVVASGLGVVWGELWGRKREGKA
jgi:hypothetical protein